MITQRKPNWLKVKIPSGKAYKKTAWIIKKHSLNTICSNAKCPNIAECFENSTATFLILGNVCTRSCRYCNVESGKPKTPDKKEPKSIADAVNKLNLRYAVITSVTRDDLIDCGAEIFYKTVNEIKKTNKKTKIELLIPDLKGNFESLKKITQSKPEIIGHNIEVVENLFQKLRPKGNYLLSLELLKNIKKINPNLKTKSGLMIGLGETKKDIIQTMKDLRKAGVDFFTIGQYLQPRKDLAKVRKFYSPKEFNELKKIGIKLGFINIESGPLVRSSYHAERLSRKI